LNYVVDNMSSIIHLALRDGFADLLRFCRTAYEHPPAGDEIESMVLVLVEASAAMRASAAAAVAREGDARYTEGEWRSEGDSMDEDESALDAAAVRVAGAKGSGSSSSGRAWQIMLASSCDLI